MRQISNFKIAFTFTGPISDTKPNVAILSDSELTFSNPENILMAVSFSGDLTKEEEDMLQNYAKKRNILNCFFVREPIVAAIGGGLIPPEGGSALLVHFGRFHLDICRFSYTAGDSSTDSIPMELCCRLENHCMYPCIGFPFYFRSKYAMNVDDQSLTMLADMLRGGNEMGFSEDNSVKISGTDLLQGVQMTISEDVAELKNRALATSKKVFDAMSSAISEWPEKSSEQIIITGDYRYFPDLLPQLNSLLPTTISEFALEAVDRGLGLFLQKKCQY